MKYYFLGVKYALKYYFDRYYIPTCPWVSEETNLNLSRYKEFLDDTFSYRGEAFMGGASIWTASNSLGYHKDFCRLTDEQLRRARAKIIFKFIITYKEKAFRWVA